MCLLGSRVPAAQAGGGRRRGCGRLAQLPTAPQRLLLSAQVRRGGWLRCEDSAPLESVSLTCLCGDIAALAVCDEAIGFLFLNGGAAPRHVRLRPALVACAS